MSTQQLASIRATPAPDTPGSSIAPNATHESDNRTLPPIYVPARYGRGFTHAVLSDSSSEADGNHPETAAGSQGTLLY